MRWQKRFVLIIVCATSVITAARWRSTNSQGYSIPYSRCLTTALDCSAGTAYWDYNDVSEVIGDVFWFQECQKGVGDLACLEPQVSMMCSGPSQDIRTCYMNPRYFANLNPGDYLGCIPKDTYEPPERFVCGLQIYISCVNDVTGVCCAIPLVYTEAACYVIECWGTLN